MDEREIAQAGDEFKTLVRETFTFLTGEFGFEPPIDESDAHRHCLVFRNGLRDQRVEVLNAFHGYDYGFEVNVQPASGPRLLDDRNLVYCKAKEEQQPGFGFLREAALTLRAFLESEINRQGDTA